jgi:hypothetical protein
MHILFTPNTFAIYVIVTNECPKLSFYEFCSSQVILQNPFHLYAVFLASAARPFLLLEIMRTVLVIFHLKTELPFLGHHRGPGTITFSWPSTSCLWYSNLFFILNTVPMEQSVTFLGPQHCAHGTITSITFPWSSSHCPWKNNLLRTPTL